MKAIEFVGQTTMFMPPGSMERGTCGQLPVMRTGDGRLVSVWKPDAADLRALNEGAQVALHIFSAVHPPVSLTIEKLEELP